MVVQQICLNFLYPSSQRGIARPLLSVRGKPVVEICRLSVTGYQELLMFQPTSVAQILISRFTDIHILCLDDFELDH